jgi:hypothetical protein
LVVQGGYVSQSKGKQLNITKKPNALDKPKPNALAPKKTTSKNDEDESNNNESTVDNGGSQKSPDSTVTPAPRAEPEVTVRIFFLIKLSERNRESRQIFDFKPVSSFLNRI